MIAESTPLPIQADHKNFALCYNPDHRPVMVGSMFGQPITREEVLALYQDPQLGTQENYSIWYGGFETLNFNIPPSPSNKDGNGISRIATLSWGNRATDDSSQGTNFVKGDSLNSAGPLGQYCDKEHIVKGTSRNGIFRVDGKENVFIHQESDTGWSRRTVIADTQATEILKGL